MGVSVLHRSPQLISRVFYETKKPSNLDDREADFIRNNDIVRYVRALHSKYDFTAAALEAPAYGYTSGMVTIGTVHGVLCQTLMDFGIPFVYSTPGKLKFFAKGPAKQKAWTKKPIMDAVKAVFPGQTDSNVSDATVLAAMAIAAHDAGWQVRGRGFRYTTPWDNNWARHVFESTAGGNKGKPGGIFLRPDEFFYKPRTE